MLENYMPSKKIVALLIIVLAILVSTVLLKSDGLQFVSDGFVKVLGGKNAVVADVDRALDSQENKTEYVFNTILPNALLVAAGKTGSGAFSTTDDIKNYVSSIADRVDYNIRKYSTEDIDTVPTSPGAVRKYISEILNAALKHAENMPYDELEIVAEAYQTKNESVLATLGDIVEEYKKLTKELQALDVPDIFVEKHIEVLNNYSLITVAVGDMRKIFTDPVASLIAIENYRAAQINNDQIFYDIGLYLSTLQN